VAHDYNNLLTVIVGHADLLEGAGLDPRLAGHIAQIRAAAERGGRLSRQLLAFSRREPQARQVVDVNETVSEIANMLRRVLRDDVQLELELSPEALSTECDPGQLEQVIVNLAVNARDALPGGGWVRIRTSARIVGRGAQGTDGPTPGEYVCLEVEDDGIGMPPDVAARIFEPFFTTKDKSRGSGLGLATVYGIVKSERGHVEVDSEVGRGTLFRVLLPRTERTVLQPEEPDRPARATSASRVMVVEDEAPLRALTARILEGNGFHVVQARNGREALDRIDAGARVDLVITDVLMPEVGGYALARALRARLPGVPILFVSGYTEKPYEPDEESTTPVLYLQKPFSSDALISQARRLVGGDA
jgi:CheY-like chemotaxis protein